MLLTTRLNRLAIAALAAATCGFPAAALVPAASGDPAPRLTAALAAAPVVARSQPAPAAARPAVGLIGAG